MTLQSAEPALEVRGLNVAYRFGSTDALAVRDVSIKVEQGEILGLVGESGSGKSTFAAAVLRLLSANGFVASGQIRLLGLDTSLLDEEAFRRMRGVGVGAVFQDPATSLCPTLTVGTQIRDALAAHSLIRDRQSWRAEAEAALGAVGLPDAPDQLGRFPHELSGGMAQRVVIAIALLLKPSLLIMDEPTSALDVTLQAQILQLIQDLRNLIGAAIVLISHDLGVVARTCDRVAVMYAGQIVEVATIEGLFSEPAHPYTRALLAAVPTNRFQTHRPVVGIAGNAPNLLSPPLGCSFASRCQEARNVCTDLAPRTIQTGHGSVCCHARDPESAYHQDLQESRTEI